MTDSFTWEDFRDMIKDKHVFENMETLINVIGKVLMYIEIE